MYYLYIAKLLGSFLLSLEAPIWKVALGTLAAKKLYEKYSDFDFQESRKSFKTRFFKLLLDTPYLGPRIAKKIPFNKIVDDLEQDIFKHREYEVIYEHLPQEGISADEIFARLSLVSDQFKNKDKLSGAVYTSDPMLEKLRNEVNKVCSLTNPLHAEQWPSLPQMEAEIVRMCANLYSGTKATGTLSSGGTDSILLACKTYRDFALQERGITKPEMIVPTSAHAAFHKAADYFKIKQILIPVDPKTGMAQIAAMRNAITSNTILMVGSAPSFPAGIMDPIEKLSDIAFKNKIGFHVDACLGGFILPFAKEAGLQLEPFDFRLPGVTSISLDTHKYGNAEKGSSVILYRNKHLARYQYFIDLEWEGGMYATPTMAGSRPGVSIAQAWTALLYQGRNKFIEKTKAILEYNQIISAAIQKIPEIELIGEPKLSVIGIKAKETSKGVTLNAHLIANEMKKRGWTLNYLPKPRGFHFCLTSVHTADPAFCDKFTNDLKESVEFVKKNPGTKLEGDAFLYGLTKAIPEGARYLLTELGQEYCHLTYQTEPKQPRHHR